MEERRVLEAFLGVDRRRRRRERCRDFDLSLAERVRVADRDLDLVLARLFCLASWPFFFTATSGFLMGDAASR